MNKEDRERLIRELKEAIPKSEKVVRDQWNVIIEGRLFKRVRQACKERGIAYDKLTPEQRRELILEIALDNHKE